MVVGINFSIMPPDQIQCTFKKESEALQTHDDGSGSHPICINNSKCFLQTLCTLMYMIQVHPQGVCTPCTMQIQ